MTETYDVLSSGIAVPANADTDNYAVNGRFAQVGDEYTGMADKRRVWTEDALQSAADELVGKPLTKPVDSFEPHPGVRKTEDGTLEVASSVPPDSVVGTVTEARYDDAMGLVWQGDLTDETMATQVENGHVEVSPVVNLDTESKDDGTEEIRDTKAIRDLTIVTEGALPGNSIEPGAAEAMSADALAQAFDESAESDSDAPDDDDPSGGEGQSTGAYAFDSTMEELTDGEQEMVAASRQLDDPQVIESEDANRLAEADALMAQAEDKEDPKVVDSSEFDALQGNLETIEGYMRDALVERADLKESTVEALDFDALCGEFEDEDGEFSADALVQNPETGTTDEEPEDGPDEGELDALQEKADVFGNTAVGKAFEEQIADMED